MGLFRPPCLSKRLRDGQIGLSEARKPALSKKSKTISKNQNNSRQKQMKLNKYFNIIPQEVKANSIGDLLRPEESVFLTQRTYKGVISDQEHSNANFQTSLKSRPLKLQPTEEDHPFRHSPRFSKNQHGRTSKSGRN